MTHPSRPVVSLLRRWPGLAKRTFELAKAEVALLAAIIIVAGGLWGFLSIAEEVQEGETHRFDTAIVLALRDPVDPSNPIGPPWFEGVVRDVTALGSQFVLGFATLAVIGFLLLTGKRAAALLVFVSVGGGAIIGDVLKFVFDRPRPDLVPHGVTVLTAGFPSNHATLSAVTYLTLGALLTRLDPRRHVRIYVLSLAALLTGLVGASRVYFGVHWPTDVLAGWCVGATWAMAVWIAAVWLQRRGSVEAAGETPQELSEPG